MNHSLNPRLSRRRVVQGAGALVMSLTLSAELQAVAMAAGKPPLTPDQLDSFLTVHQDGTVTALFGKMDMGQGTDIGIAQIVAEELDVPLDRVKVVMGETFRTLNQGGASGSTGSEMGGRALRKAAAEARRLLVEMAARKLGAPAENLVASDGVVSVMDAPVKRVSYGRLIGGRYFNAKVEWNGKIGNELDIKVAATPKKPSQYKIVGKPAPRRDVAAKVFGTLDYVTDIKVPGMLHGRMIRPPVAGSVPTAVDESSIKDISGVRIVWKQGFLGVVAEKEWNAIRAAEALKVTWSKVDPPFPDQSALYDHIRKAPVRKRQIEVNKGSVEEALGKVAKVVTAEYEWPFQSHSSMGPACAVVAIKDGKATLWHASQKPHFARDGVAKILGLPPENVHGIWIPGPGSYGRNDAGDACIDAAVLAQAVGRPVRLQGMRPDGHAWDPKGPASVHKVRAGLDTGGKIVAFHFESKAFSRTDIETNEANPAYSLAGQLMGLPLESHDGFAVPQEVYEFPNHLAAWETIPPLLDRASPLRTAHLRDPLGPQIAFASESFMDEAALAANTDPVEFRLRHLSDPRDIAVLKAVAERAQWQPRISGPRDGERGDVAAGRGIAYARRSGTILAIVAEIEVDRRTGKVHPIRFVVAHDCGLIVNPELLRHTIEHQVVYSTSRALWEEVTFDREKVTSIDWATYPILDITEAPAQVDVVLMDRPEVPCTGAGEPSTRPVAAAIANAIYDATGVRLRRAPFKPDGVKAALA